MTDRTMGRIFSLAATLAVVVALGLSAPTEAEAQASFGPDLSYATDSEAIGVGARANVGLGPFPLGVIGSFDYFFPDVGDHWELNGNAIFSLGVPLGPKPYIGAGLNYADFGAGTDTGLNILGGVEIGGPLPITPFVEGRYATTGAGQFILTAGMYF